MVLEKTTQASISNLYKEAAYSVYHNTMLEMISVLCTSAEPQSKVEKIMSMIINARQDIAVQDIDIKKKMNKQMKKRLTSTNSSK